MAISEIVSTSDTKEWILVCTPTESCEIESLKNDVNFVESELEPPFTIETDSMYFKEQIPRSFYGDGTSSLWVFIDENAKIRKRPYTPTRLHDADGNPIGSLNGAIDIHDADVHDLPVNEYFHRHTGIETTLAIDSLAGDEQITVVDSTGFNLFDHFQIENGVIENTFPQIISIVGNVLHLDRPLDNDFSDGNPIEVVVFDMNVDGSVTTVAFRLIPDKDQIWHIVRFLFSMTHGTAGDLGLFGNLDPLLKPVVLRAVNGLTGAIRTFTTWDSNSKLKDDMYDVDFDTRSSGGGTYGTTGRGSLKIGTGAVPKINGANGDYMEVLIQSDLSSLLTYRLKAQGHVEDL